MVGERVSIVGDVTRGVLAGLAGTAVTTAFQKRGQRAVVVVTIDMLDKLVQAEATSVVFDRLVASGTP